LNVGVNWAGGHRQTKFNDLENMFEWLQEEIERVKTPKFYVYDGPLNPETACLVDKAEIPVSVSYKQFVKTFGNAQFYRQSGIYLVRVFASPREAQSEDGERLLHFGRTDLSLAYFKPSEPAVNEEAPVFEWRHNMGLRRSGRSFEEWLVKTSRSAKRRFKKSEWAAIERGPAPFDEYEKDIVRARRKFTWKVVGVAENGDLQFEVHNGSEMILPYISIGIGGRIEGEISLPVDNIAPGETRIVHRDCYKKYVQPSEVEVFEMPDPGPEDRDLYWEFKRA
jgi:hypothetical protein